jgi:hypothetical protein
LAHVIDDYGWLTFLGTERAWSPAEVFEERAFHSIEFSGLTSINGQRGAC